MRYDQGNEFDPSTTIQLELLEIVNGNAQPKQKCPAFECDASKYNSTPIAAQLS